MTSNYITNSVLLEAKPFRPFKSGEEYLVAMKEDLAEWLQTMYPYLNICVDNFMERLETGVALCSHANAVKHQAIEYVAKKQARMTMTKSMTGQVALAQAQNLIRIADVKYFSTAKAGTFFSRDNVSNFITWCRCSLEIIECLLFESDDLIMRKNEKHVILCLLEVARRGARFGMLAPMLVRMERQIDREIAREMADQKRQEFGYYGNGGDNQHDDDLEEDSDLEDEEPVMMYGPVPQIVTNDLKSLDEMVRDLVEKCTCPTQFPMIRVSEGKYRIGDTKVLIFVRILRKHVMVRVGGGWDTLSHYLDKHDPCRCRSQHRTTQGARLVNRPGADLHGSHVYYDRSSVVPQQVNGMCSGTPGSNNTLFPGPPMNSLNRSRSRSPSANLCDSPVRRSLSPNFPRKSLLPPPQQSQGRSRSPTPNYTSSTKMAMQPINNKKVLPQSPVHQQAKLPTGGGTTTKNHVSSIQIPLNLKAEASLHVVQHQSESLTDNSDTTSEMSDEGYRSLGLVQDASGNGNRQTKKDCSTGFQNFAEDAENNEHQIDGLDDLNDFGLRKTDYSQRIYSDGKSPNLTTTTSPKRPATRASSVESPPPPPASPTRKPPLSLSPRSSITTTSTWNGRPKQGRPSLTCDTFTNNSNDNNFVRNSPNRRSASALPHSRRSSSCTTSPTKGRLKKELLDAVNNIDDDGRMLQEVQELLERYGSRNKLSNDCGDDDRSASIDRRSPSMDRFGREPERMSFRSPRKDSRPENHVSRIPAPTSKA